MCSMLQERYAASHETEVNRDAIALAIGRTLAQGSQVIGVPIIRVHVAIPILATKLSHPRLESSADLHKSSQCPILTIRNPAFE